MRQGEREGGGIDRSASAAPRKNSTQPPLLFPPPPPSVGGLLDTIKEGVTGFHVGRFESDGADGPSPADVAALTDALLRAAAAYGTPAFDAMRAKCIATDVSWGGPATVWEGVIADLVLGDDERAAGARAAKAAVKKPVEVA